MLGDAYSMLETESQTVQRLFLLGRNDSEVVDAFFPRNQSLWSRWLHRDYDR